MCARTARPALWQPCELACERTNFSHRFSPFLATVLGTCLPRVCWSVLEGSEMPQVPVARQLFTTPPSRGAAASRGTASSRATAPIPLGSSVVLSCRVCGCSSQDDDLLDPSKPMWWGRTKGAAREKVPSGLECRYCTRVHAREYGHLILSSLVQQMRVGSFRQDFMRLRQEDIEMLQRGRTAKQFQPSKLIV